MWRAAPARRRGRRLGSVRVGAACGASWRVVVRLLAVRRPAAAALSLAARPGRPGQSAGFGRRSWSRAVYGRRVLVGREPERAHLATLVERARHGSAGSVVVRGEPGVGKSALLDELVGRGRRRRRCCAPRAWRSRRRWRSRRCTGCCVPVMRLRDELPVPQARALRVAFGEEDGPSVEPFLVGVATLSLLTAAAEERPVLCVVDDAHWLDPATADALLFCARRLGADRVPWCSPPATRPGRPFDPQGLAELVLTGLDPDAARALLDAAPGRRARAGGHRAARRRDRRQPAGPAGAARRAQPRPSSAGPPPLPPQLHLTAHVEQAFLDRSRRLPRTGAVRAAARGRRRHRRARASSAPRRRPSASTSRPSRPPWSPGCWSATRRRARCATRWCGRRSTRPRPARTGAARTGRWPRRWPGSGTPTVRPGTAPPPPTGPTRTSSRPWRSSAPGPSDAAATSRRWRPTSARQRLTTTRRSGPG